MNREHAKQLVHELIKTGKSLDEAVKSAARVLDLDTAIVEQAFDGRRRVSPWKGRKRGPRKPSWAKPGPRPAESCIRGHAFTDENTITRGNGTKTCRVCHNDRVRAYDKKRPKRDRRARSD